MPSPTSTRPFIAIACGGTGGHLFPGMAVGEELLRRGCAVTLLISPKEIDQQAAHSARGMEVVTLPAVGLTRNGVIPFLAGAWKSYRLARKLFRSRPPQAVLAMGGFTSAPPVWAGKGRGAATFFHESNAIPGRANRWLGRVVNEAFLGFPQAATHLPRTKVTPTGTPVRTQFQPQDAAACRLALGLDPNRPVLLIMGGSQGATGINGLVLKTLPTLAVMARDLQFLHLTGPHDLERVRVAYLAQHLKAVVRPFLTEMELALGAASAAISRAGASSMAEIAALRVPSILVPYPAAVDNHQLHNARAFVDAGAARLLEERDAAPENLNWLILELTGNPVSRAGMINALAECHYPKAAEAIVDRLLAVVEGKPVAATAAGPDTPLNRGRKSSTSHSVAATP